MLEKSKEIEISPFFTESKRSEISRANVISHFLSLHSNTSKQKTFEFGFTVIQFGDLLYTKNIHIFYFTAQYMQRVSTFYTIEIDSSGPCVCVFVLYLRSFVLLVWCHQLEDLKQKYILRIFPVGLVLEFSIERSLFSCSLSRPETTYVCWQSQARLRPFRVVKPQI